MYSCKVEIKICNVKKINAVGAADKYVNVIINVFDTIHYIIHKLNRVVKYRVLS